MKRNVLYLIAYLAPVISLSVVPNTAYASLWGSPVQVSYYGHHTCGLFDKANPDGTLVTPYQKWTLTPFTEHYEWKDIDPHLHLLPALGVVSYFYEAKDSDINPQWHYKMNDFVGRTIDLGGTLDNWFQWSYNGITWKVQIFGQTNPDPLRVWKDGTRVYDSGIEAKYRFDVSPMEPDIPHTIFELAIPYGIDSPYRDQNWFGDPLTSGVYYSYTPVPPALILGVSGLATAIVGLKRKRLLKSM